MSQLRRAPSRGEGLSRYVEVEVAASLDEVRSALEALGHRAEQRADGRRVMLEGSLECAGQPVDLRFGPGVLGAVEDFGFVVDAGRVQLVCGDVDQKALERDLLAPLKAHLAQARLDALAAEEGLSHERVVEADGSTRIVVRRK